MKRMSQLPLFEPQTLSVTEVTQYLRAIIEQDIQLQDLKVSGEVSNLSRPSSGHLYFTLKDARASLRCVMWRNAVRRQAYLPRDGDAVEVHGGIGIYEAGGQYQLYADWIQPAGEGALYQEFIRLKERLEAEGFFAAERKREIPAWPSVIGIVTSSTGAALRDMLNTIRRRYPLVDVILSPTPVQGVDAPAGIVAAIDRLNTQANPDVILLARGGGSLEDLWAFNDEQVVRAIAKSRTPVITGVGHETDFTLADFVADLRAPTPTAAAELATPDRTELSLDLLALQRHLSQITIAGVEKKRWETQRQENQLHQLSPMFQIQNSRQRLDELLHRMGRTMIANITIFRTRVEGASQHLASLSPAATLERGYAVVSKFDLSIVRSIGQVAPGDAVTIQVSDGSFNAHVLGDEKEEKN